MLFVVVSYGQENNKRYEHCYFRVSKGFSAGASTTDFMFSKEDMSKDLQEESREMFFNKDIIFDVKFIVTDDGTIMRVFHLNEVSPDDLKQMFSQIAGAIDCVISPSRTFKFDAGTTD